MAVSSSLEGVRPASGSKKKMVSEGFQGPACAWSTAGSGQLVAGVCDSPIQWQPMFV